MQKFTHIDAYYQVVRYVKKVNADQECPEQYKIRGPVEFRGTVKLHGTNSGITQDCGGLVVQSRTRVITPEDDNHGFAKFVAENSSIINELMFKVRDKYGIEKDKKLTLFGEWIGPGLQGGVAINGLPTKQWVIFAAKITDGEKSEYIDAIKDLILDEKCRNASIFSIFDAPTWSLVVDFEDEVSKEKAILKFEELTESVEKECPWAKNFGISGIGEGIVWQPIGKHLGKSDLFFKTKGDKHKATKSKSNREALDPELLKGIEDFLEFSLTENRLNQGVEAIKEAGHEVDQKNTGHFLKWIGNDVQRECRLELEDNKLDWKQVAKALNVRARNFYLEKIKELSV